MQKVLYHPGQEILCEDMDRQADYMAQAQASYCIDFMGGTVAMAGLAVKAQPTPNMTVYVDKGRMYIDGLQGELEILSDAYAIVAAHPSYDRIDRLVAAYHEIEDLPETRNVMVDTVSRQVVPQTLTTRKRGTVSFLVVTGVANTSPGAPVIPEGYYSLAQIRVRASTTSILQSDILDERVIRTLGKHKHLGSEIVGAVASAEKLEIARKINGVAFNGTKDITISAENVTSTATGNIAAVNVQKAIEELELEKLPYDNAVNNIRVIRDAARYNNNKVVTGAIKITIPTGLTSEAMLKMRIEGYVYTTAEGWTLNIESHLNNQGTAWNRVKALLTPNAAINGLRFGHDGTNLCILLGTTTTVWNYPKINIAELMVGYVAVASFPSKLDISLITDETGISFTAGTVKTLATLESPSFTGQALVTSTSGTDTDFRPSSGAEIGQLKLEALNNALRAGVNYTGNSRYAWIQSGHADMASYGHMFGVLDLNPGGGAVRVNGKEIITADQFTQSLAGNGWTKLPNSLIIQWGYIMYLGSSGINGTVGNFPITFPNACRCMVVSDVGYGVNAAAAQAISKTQFKVFGRTTVNANYVDTAVNWVAIGY